MKIIKILQQWLLVLFSLTILGCGVSDTKRLGDAVSSDYADKSDITKKNKALVVDYYNKVVIDGNVDLIADYVAEDYIQHSPFVPGGRDALAQLIEGVIHSEDVNKPFAEIVRVIAEDDLVMLHVHAFNWPDENGTAIIDMFRVENGIIVEHWDVVQPVPESSVNGNSMF